MLKLLIRSVMGMSKTEILVALQERNSSFEDDGRGPLYQSELHAAEGAAFADITDKEQQRVGEGRASVTRGK